MIDYENKTRDGSSWFSHIDNCFSSGKAVFQLSVGDFNNVSIPHYLKEKQPRVSLRPVLHNNKLKTYFPRGFSANKRAGGRISIK